MITLLSDPGRISARYNVWENGVCRIIDRSDTSEDYPADYITRRNIVEAVSEIRRQHFRLNNL